jgi:sugar O-acyltransferase (sialic acid O-acetyltransferase NeuD family)
MNKRVILVGAFHEIIELCELCGKRIVGIIDNNVTDNYFGCEILGGDSIAADLYDDFKDIPLLITPDNPQSRKQLSRYYSELGFKFDSLISPKATISKSAKLGTGTIIQSGVNISSLVTIGNFVKLNSFSNVMHDAVISDYVTIAPNAVLLGRVQVFDCAYIGSNATILSGKHIYRNSLVGAGSVVTKDVAEGITVAGNPAKEMQR